MRKVLRGLAGLGRVVSLRYPYKQVQAERLAAVTGYPPTWYGGHEHLLLPPPPPERYWLIRASAQLIALQSKLDAQDTISSAEMVDYYRLRGLNDFYFFSKRIIGHPWLRWNLHGPLAWAWSAPNGTRTFWDQVWGRFRLAVLPRGHLKTTLLTQDYATWRAIKNPEERILIYTQSDDFAEQILAPIKALFEGLGTNAEFFHRLYGDRIPSTQDQGKKYKWDQHNLTLKRHGRYTDPTIKAKGFGGRVAGSHSTVQCVDDVVAEELTRLMMEKRIRAVDGLTPLYASLALGERRFVGTPWGMLDPISHTVKYRPQALVARLDWVKTEPHGDTAPEVKDMIFPPIEPIEIYGGCDIDEAMELRRKNRWFFNCQYRCLAKDEDSTGFRKEWFKYYRYNRGNLILLNKDGETTGDVVDIRTCNIFVLVDPNTGRKPGESFGADINIARANKTDHAGFIVLAVDPKNYWYVLYALRWRCLPHELIAKVFELVHVWAPQFVAIETIAAQILYVALFRREWELGRPQFNLRDWGKNTGQSKIEARIKGLITPYANGFIYHRENENADAQKGFDALEGELLDYPTAEYDDLSDTLAAALHVVYAPGQQGAKALAQQTLHTEQEQVLAKLDRGSRKMTKFVWNIHKKRRVQDDFFAESA